MDDSLQKRLNEIIEEVRQKDEKLYFKLLNFLDDYVYEQERLMKEIRKNDKIILDSDIKLQKSDQELHDLYIEQEIKQKKLEEKISRDISNLKKELESKEYDKELIGKFVEHSNALGLAIMGSPRRCGFMLLLGGQSAVDNLEKFVNENRDDLKKRVQDKGIDKRG